MEVSLIILLAFLSGCVITFLAFQSMYRAYLRSISQRFQTYEMRLEKRKQGLLEQRKELNKQKLAIQKLMFELNHRGVRPSMVSILGLCQLYMKGVETGDYANSNKYVKMIHKIAEDLLEHTTKANRENENLQ